MSTIADTTFKITNTKLYVSIVTLSSKVPAKLVKLLEWVPNKNENKKFRQNNLTRFPPDASFQGLRRLFVLVFDNT